MAAIVLRTLLVLALLAPLETGAQARGLPVMNSGFGTGGVAADVGFGNDAAGTGTTIGATASAAVAFIGMSATISRGTSDDNTVWSQAVALSMRLFGGPLVPFRITLHAGAGRWSEGVVETVRLPLSLGLAAVIPNPAFAIRPWLAPRLDYQSTTFENSDLSRTEFGLSGGIDLAFLNGMTIRSAYDRLMVDGSPGILSLGLGFSIGR